MRPAHIAFLTTFLGTSLAAAADGVPPTTPAPANTTLPLSNQDTRDTLQPPALASSSPETTTSSTPSTEGPEPAAPPPLPPQRSTAAGQPVSPSVRPYGILLARIESGQATQSYGNPNASAPTAALNPILTAHPNDFHLSAQVQQTRLGFVVGESSPVRGQLEADFVHFDQSTPTTQAFPRLRIAAMEWHPTPTSRLFMGQTWDLFGNATGPSLLPHTANLVGSLFQAGNIGFMRNQVGWSDHFGAFEAAAALGLQSPNNGVGYNLVEEKGLPTASGRVMRHLGEHGVVGASVIASRVRFAKDKDQERRNALGGELFADLTFGAWNIHSEAYVAQNLANLGALNLSQGRYGQSMRDVGGYLSAKWTSGKHALTAMAGAAIVLEPSKVLPAYSSDTGGASTPNTAAGPGLERNMSSRVGYWYSPAKGLSLITEPFVFASRFKMAQEDASKYDRDRVAFGLMLASMYTF